MRNHLLVPAILVLLGVAPAFANDRPVSDEERTKLTAALTAQGCEGGKMEYEEEDGHYEVDAARCGDGQPHDLVFDRSFNLIKKELDD
jgi:hypothetical protein